MSARTPDFSEMVPGAPVSPDVGAALKKLAERLGRIAVIDGLTPSDQEAIGGIGRRLMRSVKLGFYEPHVPTRVNSLSEQGCTTLVKAMNHDREYGNGELAEDIVRVVEVFTRLNALHLIAEVRIKTVKGIEMPFGILKQLVDAALLVQMSGDEIFEGLAPKFAPPTSEEMEEAAQDPAFLAAMLMLLSDEEN